MRRKTTNIPVFPRVATLGVLRTLVNREVEEFHESGQGLAANFRDLFKVYPQASV
jgi:CRISPR/Cas system CMR subunit Cmr4 (Cas7 group RAMP superfamily)